MKTIISLLLVLGIVSVSIYAIADEPVDLRGKQGVVNPNDLKKDDPKSPSTATDKAKPPPLTGCRKGICLRTENKCLYGCDPPDENNTIHGCSSCYSTKPVCVSWEEVRD